MAYLKNMFELSFFEDYLREKRNLAESSIQIYLSIIRRFHRDYSEPDTLESMNDFIIKHAIKKRSKFIYSVIKTYAQYRFKDASERHNIVDNLIQPAVDNNPKTEHSYLTEDELVKVINNLREQKHKIISLIQDLTGVRAGDALRVRRGDIIPEVYDGNNVLKIVVIGKGSKRNVVYIHDLVVQDLILNYVIKNRHSDDYYFMEDKTRKHDSTAVESNFYRSNYLAYYRDLKQALRLSGVEHKTFSTHDYRRCYARRVWNKFKDLHVLQELLNHQNPATTMRYLKHSGLSNIDYHKEMQS